MRLNYDNCEENEPGIKLNPKAMVRIMQRPYKESGDNLCCMDSSKLLQHPCQHHMVWVWDSYRIWSPLSLEADHILSPRSID